MLMGQEAPAYLQGRITQQGSNISEGQIFPSEKFPIFLALGCGDTDCDLQKPPSVRMNVVRAIFAGAFFFLIIFF